MPRNEREAHQRFVADIENPRLFVGRMAYIPNPARKVNFWRRLARIVWGWL